MPKRKPNLIAEAEGTLRSNKHRPEVASPHAIEMPEWLVGEKAWECWNRLVVLLGEIGYLVATDADILARYCRSHADFREAIEEMDRDGRTIETATGALKNHPAWARQKEAAAEMHRTGAELGLSPSARALLGDRGVGQAPKDDFAHWEDSA